MTTAAQLGDQILTFTAGGRALAIASRDVAEVVASPRVTRVPQSPPSLQGLANLRGRVVPILSVDVLLGGVSGDAATRVIILNGEHPIGLAVDGISAMRTADASAEADGAPADVIDTGDGPVRLLRIEPLLAATFAGRPQRATTAQVSEPQPLPASSARAEVGLLQFELAGQAFALPLEQVREVVAMPPDIAALPHADAVMVGVMPLRGDLLALVSLRALLGLPPAPAKAGARVVVASLGQADIGLQVDAVHAILRASEGDVGAVPSLLNRGAGEARIDAIVRTPGGLVSVLAAERIFEEETVAAIIAEGAGRAAESQRQQGGETAMEQFVLFRLADETYGLPIACVREVVRLPDVITRVPRAPGFLAGVMNHRGAVVPLIDQRRRFAVPGEAAGQRRVIVAGLGDLTAGFIVDAVEQILSVSSEALRATPELAAADAPIFDRVVTIEVDGRLVLLVDPQRLLDQAERDLLRDVAARSMAPTA